MPSHLRSMESAAPANRRIRSGLGLVVGADWLMTTAGRMNAMVGNILDFARGRLVGDLPLRFRPESPEAIVTQIVDELAIAHPDREIVLDCDSATPLMCDAQRIGQLVRG